MKKRIKYIALTTLAATGMTVAPARAQNPGFAPGDLILGFQTTGAGSGSYVLANLGQAGTLRDTSSDTTLVAGGAGGQLNTALNAQFGSGWFERTDLYTGVFTAGSNDEFSGFFVNGDPYNTLYVGGPRQSVGVPGQPSSAGFNLTPAAVQEAANGMFGAANIFETNGTGVVSMISAAVSFVDYDDQNSISGGIQGAAYGGVFAGGVQAVFGPGTFGTLGSVNAEAALDLYRIQGVNNQPGQFGFGQPIGVGTFEGTIVVDNSGQVLLMVVPEPSSFGLFTLSAGLIGSIRRRRPVGA